MLRFILIVLIIAVLLKVTQENAYIGFGLYLFLFVSFMIYTIDIVNATDDCDNVHIERKLLRSPASRKKFYYMLNAV